MPASDGFQYQQAIVSGTNRVSGAPCATCDGHRLVQIDDPDREVYTRCPSCNAAPTSERKSVDGRWQEWAT